ncbi:EVE domain-containing protein [Legionella sp. W05-934-2]|jgi:hypothetical protein|uniref:EVE domain-containing protein n=1 Tax=Legionella sp. W05-934-2 TaxID=1198649 RepID=UPI00346258C8
MPNWIAIASAEHVQIGRQEGFMQVCHGKCAPLQRMKPNDWVVYYSPTITFGGKDKLQSFTALGKIKEGDPYQVDMGNGFCPFRRDVNWLTSQVAAIQPLIGQLGFINNKKNWGYAFRFGLIAINDEDMQRIIKAMQGTDN